MPSAEQLGMLVGRVTLGQREEDFAYLQRNHHVKKNAWVFGADGLQLLLSADPWTVLDRIGFDTAWIEDKLQRNFEFRVALFPATQAYSATWDGVFQFLQDHYEPQVVKRVKQ